MSLGGPDAARRLVRRAAFVSRVVAAATFAAHAAPAHADVATARRVDSLITVGAPEARREVERWAKAAPLAELLWVARRAPDPARALDAHVLERALARTDPRRPLRASLLRTLARLDAKRAKSWLSRLTPAEALEPVRDGSPFRVATLLPESGPRASHARAVARGLALGLAWKGGLAPEPWPAADAGAAVAHGATLVAGLGAEDQPVLAAIAGLARVPVVAASGEPIEAVARVHAVQPSEDARGAALAAAALPRGARVAVVASLESPGPFERGFVRAADSLGTRWAPRQRSSGVAAAAVATALRDSGATHVLFDGPASELEPLLRELSRLKHRVSLLGGDALDPLHHHAALRPLLEGARRVAASWTLRPAEAAALAQAMRAGGPTPAGGDASSDEVPVPGAAPAPSAAAVGAEHPELVVQGWLAGRLIADAVAAGALHAEEIEGFLARWGTPAGDGPRGHLPVGGYGARLEVFEVRGGLSVPLR